MCQAATVVAAILQRAERDRQCWEIFARPHEEDAADSFASAATGRCDALGDIAQNGEAIRLLTRPNHTKSREAAFRGVVARRQNHRTRSYRR